MLLKIGVSSKYVKIIKFMYENTECAVNIENFQLDGLLFCQRLRFFLEFVLDEISYDFHITEGLSTDDTTLITTLLEKLQLSTLDLKSVCRKWT